MDLKDEGDNGAEGAEVGRVVDGMCKEKGKKRENEKVVAGCAKGGQEEIE